MRLFFGFALTLSCIVFLGCSSADVKKASENRGPSSASTNAIEAGSCKKVNLSKEPVGSQCYMIREDNGFKRIYTRVKDSFTQERGIAYDGVVWFDKIYSPRTYWGANEVCNANKGMRLPAPVDGLADAARFTDWTEVLSWTPSGIYWGAKQKVVDNPAYDEYTTYDSKNLSVSRASGAENENHVRCVGAEVDKFQEQASGRGGVFSCDMRIFKYPNAKIEFNILKRSIRYKIYADSGWTESNLPNNPLVPCETILWDNLATAVEGKETIFYQGKCKGRVLQSLSLNRYGEGSGSVFIDGLANSSKIYMLSGCKIIK